jgi:hypothetical protein
VASPAFIDASMFATSPPLPSRNFCGVVNYVLNPANHIITSVGAVIDARGLSSGNRNMTCTTSPWAGITPRLSSTILLPSGTIVIPTTWVLPSNTRLIGEGDSISSRTTPSGTTIQAHTSFTNADMIDLGTSIICPLIGGHKSLSCGPGLGSLAECYENHLQVEDIIRTDKERGA